MKKKANTTELTFWQFLKQKQQIIDISLLAVIFIVVGVLMRVNYPFPFFFYDSNTYIHTAASGGFDVFRPMGFPIFLQKLHGINESLSFIFFVTYTLYALASMLMLLSVKYIMRIRRHWLFILLSLCAILSPRLIFSCNYIMSDAIFMICSALYITALLWMIQDKKRSWLWLLLSLPVLWFMCRLRYSGLFFIPASIVAIIIAFSGRHKLLTYGVACVPVLFFFVFYTTVKKEYRENTHVDVFSGFSGWQNINNALTLMPEAKEIPTNSFHDADVRQLHDFLIQCNDTLYDRDYAMKTLYMWNNGLPPKQYTFYCCNLYKTPYGIQWVKNSEIYGRYASQLMRKQPVRYFTNYLIPSLWSNTLFHPFEEETLVFKNEKMFHDYYHLDPSMETHEQEHHFFTTVADPIRRVTQVIYWIAFLLCAIYFCVTIRKSSFSDIRFLSLFVILLSIVFFIGGQTIGSPNTTWRYTMPFYQMSIVFIFMTLSQLLDRLTNKPAEEEGK